jgi:hypothetical protein
MLERLRVFWVRWQLRSSGRLVAERLEKLWEREEGYASSIRTCSACEAWSLSKAA